LAAACLALAACEGGAPARQAPGGPPYTLRVLASSELTDMDTILAQARQVTGVTVKPFYTGSLAGTQTVLSGHATGRYDAIWFASENYLALSPGGLAKLDASNQIMSSPVILGLRTPVAQRLGWIGKPVSWADIARAAAAHRFTFGMTDPDQSNSGFSALVSVATVAAAEGAALQPNQIPEATSVLRGLAGAQVLQEKSSGKLKDAYLKAPYISVQAGCGPGKPTVDGLIEYESVLLWLNASRKLCQPLTLIYPSDGVITASYPLSLLTSAPAAAKNAYTRLVDYLLTPAVQRQIMQQTRRRPATPGVELDPVLRSHPLVKLPFPGTIAVVNDLLAAYNGKLRLPTTSLPDTLLFLFDSSALIPTADTILQPIAEQARSQHQLVTITGYASPDGGTDAYNLALSQRRAIAVRDRLITLGLPAAQITQVTGVGTAGQRINFCLINGQVDEARCELLRRVVIILSP
jgi:Ca-activated chloride channel family protein